LAKNVVTKEELNTIILSAAHHQENTLCHVAAGEQNVEILKELRNKVKRKNNMGVQRHIL
jgi:hypothetical protein